MGLKVKINQIYGLPGKFQTMNQCVDLEVSSTLFLHNFIDNRPFSQSLEFTKWHLRESEVAKDPVRSNTHDCHFQQQISDLGLLYNNIYDNSNV